MNSAVITLIEYQLPGDEDFSTLSIVPESAKMKVSQEMSASGINHTVLIDFLIAGIDSEVNDQIKSINNRKANFRITDADDVVYLVGSNDYPARLTALPELSGTPGSFKGYRCSISLKSPFGLDIQ